MNTVEILVEFEGVKRQPAKHKRTVLVSEDQKVWISCELLSSQALLCAMIDNPNFVQVGKDRNYLPIDWAISYFEEDEDDKKRLEIAKNMRHIKERVLKAYSENTVHAIG